MDVTVTLNGSDISDKVISYQAEQRICSGVGLLDLFTDDVISAEPWDEVVVYENGNKKGTYYVSSAGKNEQGIYELACQDASKKLQDYFITDSYMISKEYVEYARPWIKKFLNEAKVSYTLTASGQGSVISNNTSLGMDSAYNVITTLLQMCGWYMYFNESGKCIIGTLSGKKSHATATLDDNEILSVVTEKDDKMLRNRAVVWGNTDPITQTTIFVDISTKTPWDYDSKDKRTVVLGNSNIYSITDATYLAQKIIQEFAKITYIKTIQTAVDHNIKLGNFIQVKSKGYTGNAKVTTIETSMSQDGLIYTFTCDERCPRLFAWYGIGPPLVDAYVYISTWGSGVWRKYIPGSTWEDYSDGLTDLNIKDFFIKDGVFACIDGEGYLNYRLDGELEWTRFQHHNMFDLDGNEYYASDIKAIACSIDIEDNIIVTYNFEGTGINGNYAIRSWVLKIGGDGTLWRAEVINANNNFDYLSEDVESAGEFNVLSIFAPPTNSSYVPGAERGNIVNPFDSVNDIIQITDLPPDINHYTRGPEYGYYIPDPAYTLGASSTQIFSAPIVGSNGKTYSFGIDKFIELDLPGNTTNTYTISPTPAEWVAGGLDQYTGFLRYKTSTTFDLIVIKMTESGPGTEDFDITIYHYSYTIGSQPLLINTVSINWVDELWTPQHFSICGVWVTILADSVLHLYNLNTRTYDRYTFQNFWPGDEAGPGSRTTGYGSEVVPIMLGDCIYYVCYGVLAYEMEEEKYFPPPIGTYYVYWGYSLTISTWGWRIGSDGSIRTTGTKGNRYSIYGEGPSIGTHVSLQNLYTSYDWVACNGSNLNIGYIKLNAIVSIRYGEVSPYTYIYREVPMVFEVTSNTLVTQNNALDVTSSDFYDEDGIYLSGDLDFPQGYGVSSRFRTPLICTRKNTAKDGSGDEVMKFLSLPGLYVLGGFNETSGGGLFAGGDNLTQALKLSDDYDNTVYIKGYSTNNIYGFSYNGTSCNKRLELSSPSSATSIGSEWSLSQYHAATDGIGANKWKLLSSFSPYKYTGEILKHTSNLTEDLIYSADFLSEEKTFGTFTVLEDVDYPNKVEISLYYPTLIYNLPVLESGIYSLFQYSIDNGISSFVPYPELLELYEARSVDIINPATYFTEGGILSGDLMQKYNLVTIPSGLGIVKYDLSNSIMMFATISGVLGDPMYAGAGITNHLETTNFTVNPVVFFSVSGEGLFFQRNNTETYFRDYSLGLPDSEITQIRVDDSV